MKAAVYAEAIGLRGAAADPLVAAYERQFGNPQRLRPWCAEIAGRCPRYGVRREFLPARYDYSAANSVGSRGVYAWWTLESGRLYQMASRESWNGGMTRRWLTVTDNGDVCEIGDEEAQRWLNDHSASTS